MKKRNRRCGMNVKGNAFEIDHENKIAFLEVRNREGDIKGAIIIDSEDIEKVQGYTWNILATGYVATKTHEGREKSRMIYLHRILLGAEKGQEVDHINRIRHDCRKANLRICSRSENVSNGPMRTLNTSGVTGVSEVKHHSRDKKWHAYIDLPSGRKSKMFKTFSEAVEQRARWEAEFNPTGLNDQITCTTS